VRAADAEKNELRPHLREQWVIPPQENADFVAAMEDVLEVYRRPYDPQRPVVCLGCIPHFVIWHGCIMTGPLEFTQGG
jgi:hypothetical protein